MIHFTKHAAVRTGLLLSLIVGASLSADQRQPPDMPHRSLALPGLSDSVDIDFDELGLPRIVAANYEDAIRAMGFVHAQERYFQMDLLRRRASGRLSELVGDFTVDMDRQTRVYGFTGVAEAALANLPPRHSRWLEVYSDGVNAGLANMGVPPLEYTLIGIQPEPWSPRDSLLAMLMMTMDLSSGETSERVRSAMVDALPIELADFLTPTTARFDATIDAPPDDRTGGYIPAAIPGPKVIDLRPDNGAFLRDAHELFGAERVMLGSNSWAVAGSKTVHGGAILANDMHLAHSLPNIWYRVQLEWTEDGQSDPRNMLLAGVSLPGVPGVIVGSSGDLAWGFTNLSGDLVDLVRIELDPDDPNRYRVPEGWEAFGSRTEQIAVRGGTDTEFEVRTTRWGPLVDSAYDGTPLAMRWAGLHAEWMNLELLEMPWAQTLEEGLEVVRSWMGPPQNALIADANGDIAWTLSGFLPQRHGLDGRISRSWASGDIGWNGVIPDAARPQVVRPASGILFTANNRVLSGEAGSLRFGDDYSNGTRASRIREILESQDQRNELDVFRIALDTRTPMMDLYQDHLLRALPEPEAADDLVAQAAELVRSWDGTANADQVGYRLLREYRGRLHRSIIGPLLAPVHAAYPGFRYVWFNSDEPVLRLLDERPKHLLPPQYKDWDELLIKEFQLMVHDLGPGDQGGVQTSWGKLNRSSIAHPLSAVLPERFPGLLSTKRSPLDGDVWSVRVARPTFGASQRLAVSPGHEESGLLHMPGGQSGKPMSPHFKDQHQAWLSGNPLPLLTGLSQSRIRLTPEEAAIP